MDIGFGVMAPTAVAEESVRETILRVGAPSMVEVSEMDDSSRGMVFT